MALLDVTTLMLDHRGEFPAIQEIEGPRKHDDPRAAAGQAVGGRPRVTQEDRPRGLIGACRHQIQQDPCRRRLAMVRDAVMTTPATRMATTLADSVRPMAS